MKSIHRLSLLLPGLTVLIASALGPAFSATGGQPGDPPVAALAVLREVGALMDRKAYDEAIARLTAFRSRGGPAPAGDRPDPKGHHHPLIDLALGNLFLLKEDYQRAKTPLRRAVSLMPERVDAWINLAKACYETRDYPDAARCFAAAYERDPDPQHLYFGAVAHLLDKSHGEAIAAFERLFHAHPERIQAEWRENFVQALMADAKPRRALPLVRDLARQSSGEARLRWQEMLLHLYLQLDMEPEARAHARQLVEQDPGRTVWWKALVHVELTAARYTEALAALTICGFLQPLTEAEKKLWADLNLQLDIPARAAPVYAELLEKKPDRQTVEKLVSAYRETARYDEALAQLERHMPAKDPKGMMLKADLLYAARRFSDAASAYRQVALQDRLTAGQAWLMAGYAAWQVNDLEASRQAFRQASHFSGHKQAALQAMKKLEAVN